MLFTYFQKKIFDGKSFSPTSAAKPMEGQTQDPITAHEMTKMKELLVQRDNEISIFYLTVSLMAFKCIDLLSNPSLLVSIF